MGQATYTNKDSAAPIRKWYASRRFQLPAAAALLLGLGAGVLFMNSRIAEGSLQGEHLTVPLALFEPPAENLPPEPAWQTVTIRSGDSLAGIFDRLGLTPEVVHAVVTSGPEAGNLKSLLPGETLRFDIQSGELKRLDYTMDPTRTLEVTHSDSGFSSSMVVRTPEVRLAHASGVIDTSLYAAGLNAGLSEALIMQMADIFGWDVDFALDIRRGDHFLVLYEEKFVDGKKLGDGDILAAEFVNDGKVVRAVKYTDPSGHTDYYSPDGHSMRKTFLRSPVDFRRISSRFQRERFHPVLGVKRPHQGVDYAAAVGTPVKSAGDGKVIFAGTKGGYGNAVIIQHGGAYSTLYGHLSRFNKNTHVGAHVRQGQIIGYVGQTGLATGPHLHYEFRVNGVHRNPLTVKLPDASPIDKSYEALFREHADSMTAQLSLLEQVRVAASEP